jgi:hypothetical protein
MGQMSVNQVKDMVATTKTKNLTLEPALLLHSLEK